MFDHFIADYLVVDDKFYFSVYLLICGHLKSIVIATNVKIVWCLQMYTPVSTVLCSKNKGCIFIQFS